MTNVKDVEDLRHPDAEQLLHTPDPARLAYNGPDGFPRVIPVGFLWNGTAIVVCTAVTAPKVKALRKRPNVALTIDVIGPPAKALLVRGVARIEIDEGGGELTAPPSVVAPVAPRALGAACRGARAALRPEASGFGGAARRRIRPQGALPATARPFPWLS